MTFHSNFKGVPSAPLLWVAHGRCSDLVKFQLKTDSSYWTLEAPSKRWASLGASETTPSSKMRRETGNGGTRTRGRWWLRWRRRNTTTPSVREHTRVDDTGDNYEVQFKRTPGSIYMTGLVCWPILYVRELLATRLFFLRLTFFKS